MTNESEQLRQFLEDLHGGNWSAENVSGGQQLSPLIYAPVESDAHQQERMLHTLFLCFAYMLLFIPFLLCWNAIVRSLRRRQYLSPAQADTLLECAEESVRARMEGGGGEIRLAKFLPSNPPHKL
jgi:hypothetical protein